jgi:Xaa-Pro aminopeptidase
VLCDFGGTMAGYCSDITRCVVVGEPDPEVVEAWSVLRAAQQAAVEAAVVGTPCEEVDRAARQRDRRCGLRRVLHPPTGHGIGMEEHEDPYMVEGNARPLVAGTPSAWSRASTCPVSGECASRTSSLPPIRVHDD